MKKYLPILALTVSLILVFSSYAFALVNPGFETGTIAGWTSGGNGSVSVLSSWGSYTPAEGNYFALLGAGSAAYYTTLTQTVSLNAGDTLSGVAAFTAGDYLPFNDDSYVKILNAAGLVATPWYENISMVGDYGHTSWMQWSWTANASGTYDLQYGVANQLDSVGASYGLFDMSQNVVPEPATMSLLGLGLLGLLRFRKKA